MVSAETIGIASGLALALGIFAFKTAVGAYYFCSLPATRRRKTAFLLLTWGLYAALFALAFAAIARFDLFRLAEGSIGFLKSGVALHLMLCLGLLIWGVRLLGRRADETPDAIDSKGWLLLAIPCPVCASAIFLVCAFASMLFPEAAGLLRWLVPAGFFALHALFLLLMMVFGRKSRLAPLHLTGGLMILIALYFMLILLIAPQFQDAGKLYAAARATGGGEGPRPAVIVAAGLALVAGFVWNLLPRKGC